ncbi:MAG: oligosaccharide flippase family protein [Lachnospiraceae bacterium]|nr:oligosaccharide flippase family protein [Lachnospiraceae bacterium]
MEKLLEKCNAILKEIKANKFFANSILYIAASFLIKGISFLTTPIFTRLMGTADYGIVSNFTMWANFFAVFICLQMTAGIVAAKVTRSVEELDVYVARITRMCIAFALVIGCFIFLFRNFISNITEIDSIYLLPMLIVAYGHSAINLYSSYCIAQERPKAKVKFSTINSLFITLCGVMMVLFFADKSQGRIIGFVVAYGLVALYVSVRFAFIKTKGVGSGKKDVMYALTFGIPLIPHLLANMVNGNADRVFIIKLFGENEAGIYSVAYSIGAIALTFADACTDAWTPWYFSETKCKNKEQVNRYLKFYSFTIAMCFFGVMMLAPEIMKIMADETYYTGMPCIKYVALGICFLFLYRFPLCYEQYNGNTKFVAPATVICAAINIILNSIFVPKYGIEGAAFTTLLSYIILWILHEIVVRFIIKNYNIDFKSYLPAIVISCIGFVLSDMLSEKFFLRYFIIAIFCISYLFYAGNILKYKKKNSVKRNDDYDKR